MMASFVHIILALCYFSQISVWTDCNKSSLSTLVIFTFITHLKDPNYQVFLKEIATVIKNCDNNLLVMVGICVHHLSFAAFISSHCLISGDVYRCVHPGCKYFTPKRSQLNAHMRIHMSIRSRRDKLKLHIEKHHSPGSGSNTYKPRKQRTQKVPSHPSVFPQGMMHGNYGYQASQYAGIPAGQQVDTKPTVDEQMYASPPLDPMNVREQYPMYHRPQTPPSGDPTSPTNLSPNSSSAPTNLANIRQPRVAGYIVQPMSEQNQGVYTPQGDIGGLGAFMALF
jgi:hypothetical protein